jgi:hypothetical protein
MGETNQRRFYTTATARAADSRDDGIQADVDQVGANIGIGRRFDLGNRTFVFQPGPNAREGDDIERCHPGDLGEIESARRPRLWELRSKEQRGTTTEPER